MLEDLGFAVILLIVSVWIASWAILATILAGFRRASTNVGALLGVALGPLGLMAVFALPRSGDVGSESATVISPEPRLVPERPVHRSDGLDPFA
jgi:hypothetical protein